MFFWRIFQFTIYSMNKVSPSKINSEKLKNLLEKREVGDIDFILVDVREYVEWGSSYIKGLDYLLPYSNFVFEVRKILKYKERTIVLYCSSGKRSLRCLNSMISLGFRKVLNLIGGIEKYNGLKVYP